MTVETLIELVPVLTSLVVSLFGLIGSALAWKQKGYIDLKKTLKQVGEIKGDVFDAYELMSSDDKKDKDKVIEKAIKPKLKQAEALAGKKMKPAEKKNLVEVMLSKLGF